MDLIQAYKETHYTTEIGITLLIGQENRELDHLMNAKGFHEAVYITAWNPVSKELSANENLLRNQNLLMDLEREKISFHIEEGIGKDPSGDWPGEDSFLVLGLNKQLAHQLAMKYEQNAFVYYKRNTRAELVITPIFKVKDN